MKTKETNRTKDFDTVGTFRKIKDKISKDLEGKTFEEIKKYLKERSSKLRTE